MKRIVSILVAIALVVGACIPLSAKASIKNDYLKVDETNKSFESNITFGDSGIADKLSLEIIGKKMKIDFDCSANPNGKNVLEYRFALTKPFTSLLFAEPVNGHVSGTVDLSRIENGRYYLFISRAMNESQKNRWDYGDGSAYRAATINVNEGDITIDKYVNIIGNNEALRNNPAYAEENCYLDPSLKDIDFVLTDYNKKALALTSKEQTYIKKISNNITRDCDTPYKKARAIYKFIGENVYYDKLANEKNPARAYLHPYRNLRAIVDKVKTSNSTSDGKVATLCTGYSSMSIAMLRSQGIPARLVYGYHLNTSRNTWDKIKEHDVKYKSSHYWTEFYADGRWITCDTYMAGANKWERTNFSQRGQWVNRGFTNYAYFNPSEHQLSVSHFGQGIFTKAVIAKKSEVDKFRNILMTKDVNGKYNYIKLGMDKTDIDRNGRYIFLNNPSYTYTERKTGEVEKINWKNKNVKFNGNLKDFTSLKWLNLNGNPGVKYLNVSNDKELLSAYVSDCNIKIFYGLNCPKLNAISTYGNPLKLAKYNFKGKKVATVRARTGGTCRVSYSHGVHTLIAIPNKGYNFVGWYNQKGKRVTKSRELKVRLNISFERRAGFVKNR